MAVKKDKTYETSAPPLTRLFDQAVLHLQDGLQNRKDYEQRIKDMGWTLLEWDEQPLKAPHDYQPVRIKVETGTGQTKDFLFIRSGNTATFAVVQKINDVPHVLVRDITKGSGIRITSMPSGHMDINDETLADAALRELKEETGYDVINFIAAPYSTAPAPNNITNTTTSFIAEIAPDLPPPDGWRFIELAKAPGLVDHSPSQITAFFACSYFGIAPQMDFIPMMQDTQGAKPHPLPPASGSPHK